MKRTFLCMIALRSCMRRFATQRFLCRRACFDARDVVTELRRQWKSQSRGTTRQHEEVGVCHGESLAEEIAVLHAVCDQAEKPEDVFAKRGLRRVGCRQVDR